MEVKCSKTFDKIWTERPFWTVFLENDSLDKLKNMSSIKKVLYLYEDGRNRKMVIKIEFTPLPECNILKGFKNSKTYAFKIVYSILCI